MSLAAPTMVRVVRGREYESREWKPEEFGLAPVSLSEIQAASAAESAAMIRGVLERRRTARPAGSSSPTPPPPSGPRSP